jgi:eukaryotic-like serine/threonine-protein kinase
MTINPAPGTRLGPYELVSPLGAGGMGEVWRGRDTRLGRDVAIKILPAAFVTSEQARARFDREAKTISSLNHPNICTLFDVGYEDDTHFLVMELIEGESLADRLQKGAMPLDQVLRFGSQVADALERAHKQGIVHRDLKPGNVMLTKTGAKLLDFGLAHISTAAPANAHSELPTQAKPLTQEGMILGTFQYMAPEQLEGQESDARTDIFALGALLYEMATGRRAFEGTSRTSLIASIVSSHPPPIASIAPLAPPALEHVVRKCLEKDPNDRWQSAHDVASELRWISEAGSQAGVATSLTMRRKNRERLAWAIAAAATIAAVVAILGLASPTTPEPSPVVSSIDIPPDKRIFLGSAFAISPDAKLVAFVLLDAEGTTAIWLRPLDSPAFRRLEGTDGASHPFWSPDSRKIGFFADGKLNTISVHGGPVTPVCSVSSPRGATWGANGLIYVVPAAIGPLTTVPETGGTPSPLTTLREGETSHRWPIVLPDGKTTLFLAIGNSKTTISQASLDRPDEIRDVVETQSSFAWAPPGHLLYARGNLLAQRYDPKRATTIGDPVTIADRIAFTDALRALFSVADDGTVVLQQGEGIAFQYTALTWVDRSGKIEKAITEPALYFSPSLSRDGKRLAVDLSSTTSGFGDIWVFDLVRDVRSRLTYEEPNESSPLWSPDDRRIIYMAALGGGGNIHEVSSGGTGGSRILVEGEGERRPTDHSRDGEWIVFNSSGGADSGSYDIGVWSASDKTARLWLATPFNEYCAQLSPDTKWIAYQSDESGRMEIYVQGFPESDRKWMISSGGGRMPVWRGDGREIFYVSIDEKMMAVPVTPGPEFESGAPVALFDAPIRVHQARQYDVTSDGQRFLLNRIVENATPEPIMLVQNWSAKLPEK